MRYALVYGLIFGTIVILTMIAGFELAPSDSIVHTIWYGYLLMLVVLSFIFVGVKRYRDVECGGVVRFGRALLVGAGMAAFAGLAYVMIFEIYLAATDFRYFQDHLARLVADGQAAGTAPSAIAAERAQLESVLFNPLLRVGFVFLEIFPVGLAVAVGSAWLLRNPRFLPAHQPGEPGRAPVSEREASSGLDLGIRSES